MGYIRELRALIGHRPIIMVGAAVLILDRSHRLLLQLRTDNNCWSLLGGSMEPGETLEETAKREVYEETGLIIGEMRLFDIFSGPELFYQYPNGDQVFNVCIVYQTSDVQGELRTNSQEGIELRYFSLQDLPKEISSPDKPIIKKFLKSSPLTRR